MDTTPLEPAPAPPPVPFKARQARDILGYVPHALGFVPEESAVLLSLSGRQLGATLRLDLPQCRDAAGLAAFADAAVGYLRRHRAADASLLVIYTAHGWDSRPPAYAALARPLCAALAAAGLPVRDGWVVGRRHWRGLYCTDPACCPDPGHSIERIADSVLNAELVYRGSKVAASPEAALCLPEPAPGWDVDRLRAAAARFGGAFSRCWTHPETFRRTLSCWEGAITGPGLPGQELAAFLLASLGCTSVRDALVAQICLGQDAAYGGALSCGLLTAPGPGGDFPGEAPSGLPPWEPARSRQAYGRDFARILSGGSASPPDWPRVDTAARLLGTLYAAAEDSPRAACGTVLAWLEWARARGSRAQSMINAVLAESAGYRLAVLVEGLLATGILPEWSFDPATAWPGTGPRAA
ncbi:DUF4192 domain-containing protein [Arthrobacter sp. I2-34]|uniref:DUF4192 domain-containing protein n=1 Tax=Arthrobacter hankyongi TaxID=2904801 RepID=A0ABS9LBY9_9MICC|nr:DUF4192 family protein [Arthrobacter hankyongi]MCG2624197.1 DUF4192 domain-containing protein [Arthrobacter hankyongi]